MTTLGLSFVRRFLVDDEIKVEIEVKNVICMLLRFMENKSKAAVDWMLLYIIVVARGPTAITYTHAYRHVYVGAQLST